MLVEPRHDPAAELDRRLAWLDTLLEAAIDRQRDEGRWRGEDDLRGVCTTAEHASEVLAGRAVDTGPDPVLEPDPADLVADRFKLDPFERFVLLLALAPELDARYRTVFGYLNDDLTQGLPTVALALDVYRGAGPGSAPLRSAFQLTATLVRYRLIRLHRPAPHASLLRAGIAVDEWLLARIVGYETEDRFPSLAGTPADPIGRGSGSVPHVVSCVDPRQALEHALRELGRPGIVPPLDPGAEPEEELRLAARQARIDGCAVVLSGRELAHAGAAAIRLVGELAADGTSIAVLDDPRQVAALPAGWRRTALPPVTTSDRRERWEVGLAAAGVLIDDGAAATVARTHPVALERIDAAIERLAGAAGGPQPARALQLAACSAARHELGALARRVIGEGSFAELVLPDGTIAQLREITDALSQRARVLEEWGYGRRAGGRGMHLLFGGPSGTGKTMAASIIAHEAGFTLYAIDLAQVVDKYIGETEKQLDRVFTEATAAGAMLLFDEADALFGRRAEVHDARDRYANVEIAYLLQRLDAHEGVTILATNLPHHLDQAFARRLHHRVEFPMPDAALRARLWRAVLPPQVPLAADLDLDVLAERFELSGGAIRNAALTAAYLAASDGVALSQAHAARAVARELEKLGRPATRAEFGDLHAHLR